MDEMTNCPNCEGKGSDRYRKCFTCDGKGQITQADYEAGWCKHCGKAKNFNYNPKGVCDNPDCPLFVEDEEGYWRTSR